MLFAPFHRIAPLRRILLFSLPMPLHLLFCSILKTGMRKTFAVHCTFVCQIRSCIVAPCEGPMFLRSADIRGYWLRQGSLLAKVSTIMFVPSCVLLRRLRRAAVANTANRVVIRGVRFDTSISALQRITVLLARTAAIAVGAALVARGDITVEIVVAFLAYVGGVFGPVQVLTAYTAPFRPPRYPWNRCSRFSMLPDMLRTHLMLLTSIR